MTGNVDVTRGEVCENVAHQETPGWVFLHKIGFLFSWELYLLPSSRLFEKKVPRAHIQHLKCEILYFEV